MLPAHGYAGVTMSARTVSTAVGFIVLAVYVAGSGVWMQTSGSWYSSLSRPPWQPPDWVFGLIWPYNFVVLGVAAFLIPRRATAPVARWWVAVFAASVIAALAWSYLFYVPHRLPAAAVALGLAAVLTLPLVGLAWRTTLALGVALVPYQVWLAVATSLSVGYAQRN